MILTLTLITLALLRSAGPALVADAAGDAQERRALRRRLLAALAARRIHSDRL